jgi:hypothetical protein
MLLNSANITNSKSKKAKLNMSFFFLLSSLFFSINSQAQCAMCRASLEGEGNVAKAQAVNDGIVYLMIIPYLLAGFVAVIIYRMYKKRK